MEFTATSLVHGIAMLDRKRLYDYVNPSNKLKIRIMDVTLPEGPVRVKRFNPVTQRQASVDPVSIPKSSIAALAEALSTGLPVNVDNALFNSGSARSLLESLAAHTPSVYVTRPDIVVSHSGGEQVRRKVKHLVLRKDGGHTPGAIAETECGTLITESPAKTRIHPHVFLPDEAETPRAPSHYLKRHALMQSSLIDVGARFGAEVWIDQNDQGIRDAEGRFGDREGMIRDLSRMTLMNPAALKAALYVDCAWFLRGGLDMPFVFEIEHSTKIVRGLSRLQELRSNLPEGLPVRWTVVAADSEFEQVRQIAAREQFSALRAKFMPYSAVDDLRMRCEQRGLKGTTIDYVDNYLIDCNP